MHVNLSILRWWNDDIYYMFFWLFFQNPNKEERRKWIYLRETAMSPIKIDPSSDEVTTSGGSRKGNIFFYLIINYLTFYLSTVGLIQRII